MTAALQQPDYATAAPRRKLRRRTPEQIERDRERARAISAATLAQRQANNAQRAAERAKAKAVFLDNVAWLAACGTPAEAIARRLGVTMPVLLDRALKAGIVLDPQRRATTEPGSLLALALNRLQANGRPFTINQLPNTATGETATATMEAAVKAGQFKVIGHRPTGKGNNKSPIFISTNPEQPHPDCHRE